jgi:hypothetical protein
MAEEIEKLISKIKKKKLGSDHFDEFVHQTASEGATRVNNAGIIRQINYLLEKGWSIKDIEETFE